MYARDRERTAGERVATGAGGAAGDRKRVTGEWGAGIDDSNRRVSVGVGRSAPRDAGGGTAGQRRLTRNSRPPGTARGFGGVRSAPEKAKRGRVAARELAARVAGLYRRTTLSLAPGPGNPGGHPRRPRGDL